MVLLKPACGSFSNLKCLENVSYHNTHWAPKAKENAHPYWCTSCRKKSLSMMKTIPFRHGVPIPASIQHNHYLLNIVTNGTFPYHWMEKKQHIYQTVLKWAWSQYSCCKRGLCTKNYPLPYQVRSTLHCNMSLIKA